MHARWTSAGLLVGLVPLIGAAAGAKPVILQSVDRYRVMDPVAECVRVVLAYRGETYSPAYIQGISGQAFRMAGTCLCAPTCCNAMWPDALARLLGYEVEQLPLTGTKEELPERVVPLVERIKAEVRAGRPVLVWNAFTTAEWDVVCGYDDETHEFVGRGSYAGLDEFARADEKRTIEALEVSGTIGPILVGQKTATFDARKAEVAALREAVRHARAVKDVTSDKWCLLEGIQCYDRWAHEFATDPERKREPGDTYCLGIYLFCRRSAPDFLREIAPGWPGAAVHLEHAAEHFVAEADELGACESDLGWQAPEGPDAARNARVASRLAAARDQYAEGIKELARALEHMESAP